MSVLSSLFGGGEQQPIVPIDPGWHMTPKKLFIRLIHLRPKTLGLEGVGGVFIVWHSGARPGWVCCGKASDLAETLQELLDSVEVTRFDERGGAFVTWSTVREEYRDGVVNYMRKGFEFAMEDGYPGEAVDTKADVIPVVPPGQTQHGDIYDDEEEEDAST